MAPRTVTTAGECCQGKPSQSFVKIVERVRFETRNETFSNFRDFLSEYCPSDVGFRARRGWPRLSTSPTLCPRHAHGAGRRPADIGIIPAAAYAEIPESAGPSGRGHCLAPGGAIDPAGQQIPVENIRTVALDTSSMTSVALTKVLFENWLGGGRTFTPMAPDSRRCSTLDAGLGDRRSGAAESIART